MSTSVTANEAERVGSLRASGKLSLRGMGGWCSRRTARECSSSRATTGTSSMCPARPGEATENASSYGVGSRLLLAIIQVGAPLRVAPGRRDRESLTDRPRSADRRGCAMVPDRLSISSLISAGIDDHSDRKDRDPGRPPLRSHRGASGIALTIIVMVLATRAVADPPRRMRGRGVPVGRDDDGRGRHRAGRPERAESVGSRRSARPSSSRTGAGRAEPPTGRAEPEAGA